MRIPVTCLKCSYSQVISNDKGKITINKKDYNKRDESGKRTWDNSYVCPKCHQPHLISGFPDEKGVRSIPKLTIYNLINNK